MSDPLTHEVLDAISDQEQGRSLPRALTPFRNSSYRRLAVALVLSSFSSGVWVVALVWEVIRLGGGAAALSVPSTAGAVGVLVPALLAGVVADRVAQKSILLVVAVLNTLGMAVIAALSLSDQTQLWHLAVVAFAGGAGMAFYYPAYSAWLPALVPASDLQAVNGFEGMVRPTIGQAIGPAMAGVVVGAASPGAAVAVAAAASLLGVLALTFVPKTPVRRDLSSLTGQHPIRSALHDMKEGYVYMVRTPWLLATLLFASVLMLMLMGPLEVLIPFLIKDQLGGGPSDHALVLAGFGVGGALGSLAMASVRMPRRYLTFMNVTWGLACLPFLLVAVATAVWQVVVAAFVMGMLASAPMVIWGTLLQRRVPSHLLGRVASLDFFVSISLMPVSMAVAGPVAEAIGLRATFTIAGLVPLVVAVVATVWAKLPADEIAHPLVDDDNASPPA